MTVGLELEWADVDRRVTLPPGLGAWNAADYTIVNSDGHANDPTGTDWPWGGEINTRPTQTATEQAEIVRALVRLLKPTINYRCNLHVHVQPDENLLADVTRLQCVAAYFRKSEPFVYTRVEPIYKPLEIEYLTPPEFAGAMRRYRRRLVSHHYRLPEARYLELLSAETIEAAMNAFAPPTKTRKRNFAIAPRPGMNLRSLVKHGTIEYRHFPGTCDPIEIEFCAEWALRFTAAAVAFTPTVEAVYASRDWRFPRFQPYDHALELGYRATTYQPGATRVVRVHGEPESLPRSAAAGGAPTGVAGE